MDLDKYKTLNDQVRYILENYPETRNSDIALTVQIWKKFYPDYIRVRLNKINEAENYQVHCVDLADLNKLPREDNIKRIRANIQNVFKEFLPTLPEVVLKRKINENFWKEEMRKQYNRNYCRVRADLKEAVPIRLNTEADYEFLPIKHKALMLYILEQNDTIFKINYNNTWYFADSIDFEF